MRCSGGTSERTTAGHGLDMDALGEQLAARKQALLAAFKRDGLPPPETRSFTGHEMQRGARLTP